VRASMFKNLEFQDDSIDPTRISEWDNSLHEHVEVSPIFIQIVNKKNKIIFSSTNLLEKQKLVLPKKTMETFYNGKIYSQMVRLGRFPIQNKAGVTIGHITLAISERGTFNVLSRLIWTLIISFPVVIFVLYLASSIAASTAIRPVNQLIRTASRISDSNISTRLKLPPHKDELFKLTQTLNELLARIEASLLQQKQFTSDASHEIRTPMAAIRGTLEVLLRKKREPEVYVEKISRIIKEFDRLDAMLDQLLQLARIGSEKVIEKDKKIKLEEVIHESIRKWRPLASEKKIHISSRIPKNVWVYADGFYLELISDNLLSNAIKYGKTNGNISFQWDTELNTLSIQDDGIGISQEHLPNIFNRFYRADESRSSVNSGNGLGLSIVKRLANLQGIDINAESIPNLGSTFYLRFPY